jgi:hypothetical protein
MSSAEYFDDIQDVKITKDMLDLEKHIVEQKSGHFEPAKFEDHYEQALQELLDQKRKGQPIAAARKPAPSNVFNLMDALKQSIESEGGRRRPNRRKRRRRCQAAPQGWLTCPSIAGLFLQAAPLWVNSAPIMDEGSGVGRIRLASDRTSQYGSTRLGPAPRMEAWSQTDDLDGANPP